MRAFGTLFQQQIILRSFGLFSFAGTEFCCIILSVEGSITIITFASIWIFAEPCYAIPWPCLDQIKRWCSSLKYFLPQMQNHRIILVAPTGQQPWSINTSKWTRFSSCSHSREKSIDYRPFLTLKNPPSSTQRTVCPSRHHACVCSRGRNSEHVPAVWWNKLWPEMPPSEGKARQELDPVTISSAWLR